MNILAIETSCDETAVAVVQRGQNVLSNIVSSQIDLHAQYGGVVPEVASRAHAEVLNILLPQTLNEAKVSWKDIAAVAATCGPGLIGALLVGLTAAKTVSYTKNIPLIAVNHLEGHVYANFLDTIEFDIEDPPCPFITLIVSGGHTQIMYTPEKGRFELLGRTQDDSAGEAFDKVARVLGLGYPGGPVIDRAARDGDAYKVPFPKLYNDDDLNFSFSGIKTAVLHRFQKHPEDKKEDVAASFQRTAVEYLVQKTIAAALSKKSPLIFLAGGVSANSLLRRMMTEKAAEKNIKVHYPQLKYCTDNAAMIAAAAYPKLLRKDFAGLTVEASASLII
jgi:N6-L-threonylcarbamoyladenine synthase